jgi:hypothetical protein
MHRPVAAIALALALALAVTTTAVAEPPAPAHAAKKAKKCFKKKHGKRVRVKCPKKKPARPRTPGPTAPLPNAPAVGAPTVPEPATPAPDPVRDRMSYLVSGEMMRYFANGSDAGGIQAESTLHTCSDKTYQFFSQSVIAGGGLTGTSKTQDAGRWEITQAELSPAQDEIFGKIKLTPADGSPAYEVAVNLVDDGSGGIITLLDKVRWFRVASTVCS